MGWGEGESDQHYFKAGIVSKGPWGNVSIPKHLTDVILTLSWIDLRPLVHLCSDSAHMRFVIFPFRAGHAKRRSEFHFGLFCVLFFVSQSHSMALFRVSNTCRTWRIPSCWMPRELNGFSVFSGAWWKGANRCRFQLCHSSASQKPPDVSGLELSFSLFSLHFSSILWLKLWRNLRAILETQGLESLKYLSSEICIWPYSQCP